MEPYEVLDGTLVTYDEIIGRIFEQPLLYVDVSYRKQVIFFIYHLDNQQQWTFKEFRIANGLITNYERNYTNFHEFLLFSKIKEGTFKTFNQDMNAIEPTLLKHPKIRLKAAMHR